MKTKFGGVGVRMCQLVVPIFSYPGPPTNLLLHVNTNRQSFDDMHWKIEDSLVDAWKSSGPCPWPSTF